MTNTTNYNLNIVEGTDIVNPLTQFNPNFNTIDGVMKNNADAAVSPATCIKSGTVHTITRSNTGSEMFVFTATGDWETGDTMTVDGTPVTPVLPDGTALLAGSYLINAEVLASIKGSKVTVYSNKANDPIIPASSVPYNSETVADALDSLNDYQSFDIASDIASAFPDVSQTQASLVKIGNIGIINVRFKTNNQIASGSVNLSSYGIAAPNIEFKGALSSLGGTGGMIQYYGTTLVLRSQPQTVEWVIGQVIFPVI